MKLRYSIVSLLALSSLQASQNLGTLNISSSTIDDKFIETKNNVSSTAIISGKEIESHHAENLADVLNTIPGLTVRANEGDSNKIHIRGIATEVYMGEKPGVAIVIDGVPVQERAGSVNIDSDNIKSIKIIKGGASYLYGNDALAGAVIITTKRPKVKNETTINLENGSFGYEKYLARFNGSTDTFALTLQASKKASDGYWDNSDYWAKSFNGKIQYYIDDTSDITFGADHSKRYENDTGSLTAIDANGINQIDTNPTSVGEVGFATNYKIDLDKYFLTYSNDIDESTNFMTQIYHYTDTTTNKSNPYDTNSDGINDDHKYDAYAKTEQNGLKSEFRKSYESIAYMIGLDLARNEEDKDSQYRVDYTGGFPVVAHTTGEVVSNTTSKEKINALYGELKYAINNKVATTFNTRVDKIKYNYKNNMTQNSWDKDFTEYSYKLGATYKLKKDSIFYTNTSTGFRVPTLNQMYAGDMSTSTYSGTYSNNTDIKTEKTYNYEIGFRTKTDMITYDISLYQINRDDVIGRSSGNYASTKGVDVEYTNMADIENKGIEFSLNTSNKKPLFFNFNYTYLDSKYTKYDEYNLILNEAGVDHNGNNFDGNNQNYSAGVYNLAGNTVPRTSKHTINLATNYRVIQNALLTAEVNYRSSQYADELNRVKIDGYSVVNLKTKYNTKVAKINIEFFAKINNLFDKQYYMMPRVTSDRNSDGVYDAGDLGLTVNPGRSYLAGVSVKF